MSETAMKVTEDTVTISELKDRWGDKGQSVQLKHSDPNELELYINKMPASTKGKSMKYSRTPVTRTLKGNKKQLKLFGVDCKIQIARFNYTDYLCYLVLYRLPPTNALTRQLTSTARKRNRNCLDCKTQKAILMT